MVIPISSGIACGLAISNDMIYEIIRQIYNKYKKQYEKNQQNIKSFVKLYRKSLQDHVIHKNGNKTFCKGFTECLDETRSESFLRNEHKYKNYFS